MGEAGRADGWRRVSRRCRNQRHRRCFSTAKLRRSGNVDGGPEPLARLWAATLGEHPRIWVPIVGVAYEAAIGLLALSDGRRHRLAGMTGIAAFHVGLLVMGGWSWALPVLAIVVPAIVLTARAPRGNGLQP